MRRFVWLLRHLTSDVFIFFFFFFQAEDGIRDYKVTGVQTCALPISQRIRGLLVNLMLSPASFFPFYNPADNQQPSNAQGQKKRSYSLTDNLKTDRKSVV